MFMERTTLERDIIKKIGLNIRKERETGALSQRDLSDKLGYRNSYSLYRLEAGRVDIIDTVILCRIATALKIPVSRLIKGI